MKNVVCYLCGKYFETDSDDCICPDCMIAKRLQISHRKGLSQKTLVKVCAVLFAMSIATVIGEVISGVLNHV